MAYIKFIIAVLSNMAYLFNSLYCELTAQDAFVVNRNGIHLSKDAQCV